MIYKGKGKRTRLDGVVVRHGYTVGYYGGGYISRRRKQWKNLTRLLGETRNIYLFFVREINFEFIFIMKFIERSIENAKLFLMIYLNIIIS